MQDLQSDYSKPATQVPYKPSGNSPVQEAAQAREADMYP